MVGLIATESRTLAEASRPPGELSAAFAAVRMRLGLVAVLFATAGVAWWATARRMAGMDAGPGADLGTLGWFVGVWLTMMAAMMFPSVAPTVALYARMTRRRGPVRPLLFAGAYLAVWGMAGLVAYGLVGAGRVWFARPLAWSAGGHWLSAGLLAATALYELTPLKGVCLARCRSPLGFLLGVWRDGRSGALRMGARHAAWCLGCCWALMTALFALGVMSLEWMAVVGGLIAAEKTLPWRRAVVLGTTVVLLGLAGAVAAVPNAVLGSAVPAGVGHGGEMGTMR